MTYNDSITERSFLLTIGGFLNNPWKKVILNGPGLGPGSEPSGLSVVSIVTQNLGKIEQFFLL
jgi:hypothetical protein